MEYHLKKLFLFIIQAQGYVIKSIQPIKRDSNEYFRQGTMFSTYDRDKDFISGRYRREQYFTHPISKALQ